MAPADAQHRAPGARPTHLHLDAAGALGLPQLTGDLARVEAELAEAVTTTDPFLTEVVGHLVGAGGKRVRPVLALCAGYGAATGPVPDDVVTGAVAVELVHLGSLYHDDVIDEAATRRGVESVNARWSNIVAILAGDFLLARASSLAAGLGVEVAAILAATIGDLCQGQVAELTRLFDTDRDEAAYLGSIAGKTASLMAASCRIGALCARLDRPAVDGLTAFGRHMGMIFQICDDVLDLTGAEADVGKPCGLDLAEGVYTLPVIYAMRTSPELASLLSGPLDAAGVARARALCDANGAVADALAVADRHGRAAMAALSGTGLEASSVAALGRLCSSIIDRSRAEAERAGEIDLSTPEPVVIAGS